MFGAELSRKRVRAALQVVLSWCLGALSITCKVNCPVRGPFKKGSELGDQALCWAGEGGYPLLNRSWFGTCDRSYLVDPASSHMLVSKIKPCMSKYKQLYSETANGSLNQLSFI